MRYIERPAKSKMAVSGPQNAQWNLERHTTQGYWTIWELSLNRIFNPSTPFMRNIELPVKSRMAAMGAQNGRQYLEKVLTPGYLALQTTFVT